ncbi:MAG: KpsF/GutQ family sugar-phosphate isomerase [Rhodobacteraceae bacterium]|nr:KpsF/GutQ family sugar-phosphate isomerase [Paracoccaceae bacterium]
MPSSLLETGRAVIATEIDALKALEAALDSRFEAAVELILAASGRVIVSGMGKSGHVARKIAATFASTGTPAQFVHPAEASHGDLGMLVQGDVVMMLSNSGETPELSDMVAHTRRFGIPLIGVASRPDSTLLRQSDVALVLPQMPEACGTGIVPTSSTTMTLALGDALAVALMKHRDFTPELFRQFHPGGKLGARLSTVADLMHGGEAMPMVGMDTAMGQALITMSQKGFGVLGVTAQDGTLAGIVTDGDLRRHLKGLLDRSAGDVMTSGPKTIATDALAEEAVRIMQDKQITCLFAVSPDRPDHAVGLITIHDCLRAGVV